VERAGAAVADPAADARLTVYLGRRQEVDGRLADRVLVELLREHGLAAATVLLGVDGLLAGTRQRARFFGSNRETPLLASAVGPGATVAALLPVIARRLGDPPVTVELVRVCKGNGRAVASPEVAVEDGLQRLTIHAGADARAHGHPLPLALVQRLREEGAAGATMLRGTWGFTGSEAPHGDRVAMRRRTPTLVVALDTPAEIRRLWPLVDELTAEAGLVTSELVPGLISD
jgi:PII-like signaling protein